jgi:hypothetical protein
MINFQEGDLFEAIETVDHPVMIPHVCNNIGAWGSGFVVPLGQKYPESRKAYLELAKIQTLFLGETHFVKVTPNVVVANMVAQTGVSRTIRALRYPALVKCMQQVAEEALKIPNCQIHTPLFGAGLAGGNWLFIEELIKDCWEEQGILVNVHYLRNFLPEGFDPSCR